MRIYTTIVLSINVIIKEGIYCKCDFGLGKTWERILQQVKKFHLLRALLVITRRLERRLSEHMKR